MATAAQHALSEATETPQNVGFPGPAVGFFAAMKKPGKDWDLPGNYKFKKVLGSGSYGAVCEAVDETRGTSVAIKRIPRVFDDVRDGKRILRELAILIALEDRGPRNPSSRIVQFLDVFVPQDLANFQEIYLVMHHHGQDLRTLARRSRLFLDERDVKTLLRDVLLGLRELHDAGIFHRDLKPANCLVQQVPEPNEELRWQLRVCDFGHARAVGIDRKASDFTEDADIEQSELTPIVGRMQRSLTCHVATRWYRAPELILLQGQYTAAVDVWSAGCIAAELFRMLPGTVPTAAHRGPLFPGKGCFPLSPAAADAEAEEMEASDQLAMILKVVGSPGEEEVEETVGGTSGNAVIKAAKDYISTFPGYTPRDLHELFPASSEDSLDLLGKLLRFSPQRRVSVDDALSHTFFTGLPLLSNSEDTVQGAEIEPLDFESEDLTVGRLRKLLLREIRRLHPEMPADPPGLPDLD